jgi:amino acid permease
MNPKKTAITLLLASMIVFAISDYYVNNPGTAIQKSMYRSISLLENATGIIQFLNIFHYASKLSFYLSLALGAFLILDEMARGARKEIERTKQEASREEMLVAILILLSPLILLSKLQFMLFQMQTIFFFLGTVIFMTVKSKAHKNWIIDRTLQIGSLLLIGTLLKLPAIALAGGYAYAGLLQKAYYYSVRLEKK